MPQKPRLESVVVLVVSLIAIGMTVAALLTLARESTEASAAPAAEAGVPVAPAAAPGGAPAAPAVPAAAPAARPGPDAGRMQCKLDRKAAPAAVPAATDHIEGRPRCRSASAPGRPT